MSQAPPLVALVGNPNTGKTTLFNALTGSSVRVGNYPGITVERSMGRLRGVDRPVDVLDVPGAYSLVARSDEERIAVDALLGLGGATAPALVVVVIDATALERNLYFALQVLELGRPTLIALNQMDAAERAGVQVDPTALADTLGVPVVPTVGTDIERVSALAQAIARYLAKPPPAPKWPWSPSDALAADIDALAPQFSQAPEAAQRAMALWALMSVEPTDSAAPPALRTSVAARLAAAEGAHRDLDLEIASARYQWIDDHAADFVTRSPTVRLADRADRLLLHPIVGFAAFLTIMAIGFQALFSWSDPFIGLVEGGMAALSGAARDVLPAGIVADFVAEALIGGVGNVLVFLPQIALLFVFIGVMEDSGYMARVAFLMDRIMRRVGLHGRAFVPMLSGFACAIPAILGTRTLERRRDRLLTMMVLPLMTCSARLPVYTLIIAATVPATTLWGVFSQQSLVMLGMYVFAIVIALIAAAVLGRTVLKGRREPLLLELPDYRVPSARSVGRLVFNRSGTFVREAGTVILLFTVVMWGLSSFPRNPAAAAPLEAERARLAAAQPAGAEPSAALTELDHRIAAARTEHSYAGRLGKGLEPVMSPLGFDWRINVGVVGAFAAREVFVSSMGIIYGVGGDVDEESPSMRRRMAEAKRPDGTPVHTPLTGLSLLVFFALACQCMSTIAVVRRESGGWKWPSFMFAYMTALAWLASFTVYQVGGLLGFS